MFEGQLSQNMVIQNIRATNETEKEIYRYLKVGKPIEIAAFLVVDQEEVTSPSLFRGICDLVLNGSISHSPFGLIKDCITNYFTNNISFYQ
ncbi:hypothetical protein V6N13_096800 [Hibiscus sabdariffa]